jgi:hypothetical protein
VGRYILSSRLPIVDINLPLETQLAFLKAHALDHVDCRNDGLIYSDVFTNMTIEYLTYYRNPQLKAKGIDVLAVSLDDSRDACLTFLTANKCEWPSVYEQGGWSGKVASEYFVYATPTMFLISKGRRILSKPLTADELLR